MSSALSYLLVAAGAVVLAGLGAQALYDAGGAAEAARRNEIEARADKALQTRLTAANAKVRDLQAALDSTADLVATQQSEIEHAKSSSADLQSRLAAGEQRLSVLVRIAAGQAAAARIDQGASPAAVDPGVAVSASLDGRAAADLEWLRQTRNGALAGLHSCIVSYDALKVAVDGAASH